MLDHRQQLLELRQRLADTPAPSGPSDWAPIQRWVASARPLIRECYRSHEDSFEHEAQEPPWAFGGVIAMRGGDAWGGPYVDPEAARAEAECEAMNASANVRYGTEAKERLLAFLDGLLRLDPDRGARGDEQVSAIKIFVSHASDDVAVAGAFVGLLEGTLVVPDGVIRCTSVEGYRLPPGVHGSVTLRAEIANCDVLIGLLTEESLKSGYVTMEFGAAWGLQRMTCAVLAPNVDFKSLPGPLVEHHAIRWDRRSDLAELVDVIAKATGFPKRSGGKAQAAVEGFLAVASSVSKPPPLAANPPAVPPQPKPISDADASIKILGWLGVDPVKANKAHLFADVDHELGFPSGTSKRLLAKVVSDDERWDMLREADESFMLQYDNGPSVSSRKPRRW